LNSRARAILDILTEDCWESLEVKRRKDFSGLREVSTWLDNNLRL
jgi:hypothetical protein